MPKGIRDTRTQIMDDFNHIIKILDIGIISELERVIQTTGIQSIRHPLQMKHYVLSVLDFKKGGVLFPVPNFQIASLYICIEY